MVRYRIKIVTYKSGRKEHFAQVRRLFRWNGIAVDGEEDDFMISGFTTSRTSALDRIDKHFTGNAKVQTIEFEYIVK